MTLVSNQSQIDFLVIFDRNGRSLLQGNYHPGLKRAVDSEMISGDKPQFLTLLAPVFTNEESLSGLLTTKNGVMVMVARPIFNSEGQGPSQGVLIMGRFLTKKLLNDIVRKVHVEFDLLMQNDVRLSRQEHFLNEILFDTAKEQPKFHKGFLYQTMKDIEDQPVLILRSQIRGEFSEIGRRTSFLLKATLLLVSFILLICLAVYRGRMKISELALLNSEERYRTLFANKHVVMLLVDPENGDIVEANSAASAYYGWSIEELKRMKVSDLNLLPREEVLAKADSAKTGSSNHFVFQHRRADGSICDVEVYSGPITVKGKVLLYSIVHDITARKQAEKALRESSDCLQAIMNSIDANIYIADMQTHELLFLNEYSHKTFGNDAKGQKCWKVLQGMDEPCSFCSNDKLLDEEGRPSGVFRWEFQNRVNQRWYDIADHAIQWTDGRLVRMEIATDITERKMDEEKRFDLERQLQQAQKVESLGRMAGAIAHHYNNLLGAVLGNLELAMMEPADVTQLERNLSEAMNATSRAAEIGKLMLAYLGQTASQKEQLDLAEICKQHLPELKSVLPAHIVMSALFPLPGPVIYADADQVIQIFSNLVTNAMEAMGEKAGVISVTIRILSQQEMPSGHIYPAEFQPEEMDYACLEVSDEGKGIKEGDIVKIFDPFFSTKFTGRGLGLPVVMGGVKAHYGCVAVESRLEYGSKFRVFFPLFTPEHAIQKPPWHDGKVILKPCTVLIAEDEPTVCETAVRMLRKLGMAVLIARDGLEAVEIFRQHEGKINCVLSDVTMPRMDGWETLAALRKLVPGIPVILMSGYDRAQVMEGDHREMPQAFLRKPYGMDALKRALAQALASLEPNGLVNESAVEVDNPFTSQ